MNRYREPYWATSSNETEVHSFNHSFTQKRRRRRSSRKPYISIDIFHVCNHFVDRFRKIRARTHTSTSVSACFNEIDKMCSN